MHEYRRFLQTELDKRGWTAGALARRAGMHRQTISKILKDDRQHLGQMPDNSTLEGIARGFGISAERVRLAAARSLVGYTEEHGTADSGSDNDSVKAFASDHPDSTDLPPLSSVAPFRGVDSLRWRLLIESKPESERTDEERAWLAASKAEQSRLGQRAVIVDDHRNSHVPSFLDIARMTWTHVTDLAASPEGDPEREAKAARAIVTTADTLTDALLRLNVGPTARPLIQEMGHRSHELMKEQVHSLQAVKNAALDPSSGVEEHFESRLVGPGDPPTPHWRDVDIVYLPPPSDAEFGPSSLDDLLATTFTSRLREIFKDVGREDPSLDLSDQLDEIAGIVSALPAGVEQRAARLSGLQDVMTTFILRAKNVKMANDAAPAVIDELMRMLNSVELVKSSANHGSNPLDALSEWLRDARDEAGGSSARDHA